MSALFALVSLYAYSLIGSSGASELSSLKSVFLLSVGLSGLAGVAYIALRGTSLVRFAQERVSVDARVPAAIIGAGICASVLVAYLRYSQQYFLIIFAASAAFEALTLVSVWPLTGSAAVPKIVPLTEVWSTAFVQRHARLRRVASARTESFRKLLLSSGVSGNASAIAAKSVAYSLLALIFAVLAAIVATILVGAPALVILFVPLAFYFFYNLKLRDAASARGSGVEKELPFFSVLAEVLTGAGTPLYDVFQKVASESVFPQIAKEGSILRKYVTVLGMNSLEALERLSTIHPSRRFASFITGYTSKMRSGGALGEYFSGESGDLLRRLESDWARYGEMAGGLGSMMLTLLVILPILILITSLFTSSASLTYLSGFTFIAVPIFTTVMVVTVSRMQPSGQDPVHGNPRIALALSLLGALPSLLLNQVWIGLATGLFIFSTFYGLSVLAQRTEAREADEAVPRFLGDLMEYKRQEYDIPKAVIAVAKENRYNGSFNSILDRVGAHLQKGSPLDEARIETGSRLAKMTFMVLGEMSLYGGGSVDTLNQLSTYVSKVAEARGKASVEMKPYIFLAYASPLLLAFGIDFTRSIVFSFSSHLSISLSNLPVSANLLKIGYVPPALTELSNILIVVASAALGVISAKIVDFTVKNTLRVTVNVALAIIATFILAQVDLLSFIHA
ncbi:MAG: type II secretion system F family protein [Nitrososphaerales archaeon]|nr:type II secretion system F family protein [Nitrososphaerales archaeon]